MATPTFPTKEETSVGDSEEVFEDVFTYPNGSCVPSPEELARIPPHFLDIEGVMHKSMLVRVPMWIFSACSMYIAIMMIVEVVRKKRQGKTEDRNVTFLKYGLLVASCFTAINLTYWSAHILVEINGTVDCTSSFRAENVMYWLNVSVIYFVLWLRQRVVYSQRCLREAVSEVTAFFSYAILVLVIFLPICNSVIFFIVLDVCYDERTSSCRLTYLMRQYVTTIIVSELVVPIVLPLALLGLFAWPLIRYHRTSKNITTRQRSLLSVLWRISTATALCLVTDIATMICNGKCDAFLKPAVRNFSLFCNLTCSLITFAEWGRILLPMLPEKSRRSSASTRTPDTTDLRSDGSLAV